MGTVLSLDGSVFHGTPVHGLPLPPPTPGRRAPTFNGNGQYVLPPPPGETKRSFTRASTVAKTLEDTYMLDAWARRMILLGVQASPDLLTDLDDLVLSALAAGTDPTRLPAELRNPLNRMAEEAHHRAGGTRAAEFGTATHAWCEWVDLGLGHVLDVPEMFRPWVLAHRRLLAENGLTPDPDWCERTVLHSRYGVAGTLDRVLVADDGRVFLGDIKTSKGMEYSWLYFAIQLAIYHGADYVLSLDGRAWEPKPALDPDTALIIHLPSTDAEASRVVPIDMGFGRDALDVAMEVRRLHRVAEGSAKPVRYTVGSITSETARRYEARLRLETCRTEAEMADVWQQYQDVWTDALTDFGMRILRVSAPRESESA